mmetsp:Transcript_12090/g.17362  ORF Transcript_12090/g.17362 Transcript_12090/m.17362 type:complete len:80 (-) Transcript_12090:70-309(-)
MEELPVQLELLVEGGVDEFIGALGLVVVGDVRDEDVLEEVLVDVGLTMLVEVLVEQDVDEFVDMLELVDVGVEVVIVWR